MKFVPTRVSRSVSLSALKVRSNSPAILLAAGVVGVGATVVLACKATLKLEETIDDAAKSIQDAKIIVHENEQERNKDIAYAYIKSSIGLVRLYAPTVIVGCASVGCLVQSNRILSNRLAGVTAAYSALDHAFRSYRERVIADQGAEKDAEYRHGVRMEAVETAKGTLKAKKVGPLEESMYARFFGEDNENWKTTPEYNIMFLRQVQQYLNDMLRARGYVLLNEAYKELGFHQTTEGAVVGWVSSKHDTQGDGWIDFGVFSDENRDAFYEFVTGNDGSIMVDFNVDGPIYHHISRISRSKRGK